MLAEPELPFQPRAREEAFAEYIQLRMRLPHFANARSIRNALDRARLRQANRLFEGGPRDAHQADLVTMEAEDIRASRVFREGRRDDDPPDAAPADDAPEPEGPLGTP